jgi:hypothetical protein
MARIKIKNLSQNAKISQEELDKVRGGLYTLARYTPSSYVTRYPTRTTAPITAVNWGTPVNSTDCQCMGMPQDPVTVMLPG